jgi:hypothetical protein
MGLLMTKIWIPGKGEHDIRVWRVDKAVREYNERLMFGRNEETGDWCVFIKAPHPQDPIAVLGFGDEIPEPDAAIKRLYEADTLRHGDKILNTILREQADYKKQLEYASSQASEESAEVIEHMMRMRGDSPVIKSFSKEVKRGSD